MCLILFANRVHPLFPLVVAANRDEFFQRPTKPLHHWEDPAGIIAGQDLSAGGTWMGLTCSGRFAALTNFRDLSRLRADVRSRGELAKEFLTGTCVPAEFIKGRLTPDQDRYNGFSILLGDLTGEISVFSNYGGPLGLVPPGIHGLSNHFLDTPWPKVVAGKAGLSEALSNCSEPHQRSQLALALMEVLADDKAAPDEHLPDTGVGLRLERLLSPRMVRMPQSAYGTRSSTVLIVQANGEVVVTERTFDLAGTLVGEVTLTCTVGR